MYQVPDFLTGKLGLIPLTIGVTGHRDIPAEDVPDIEIRFDDFLMEIQSRYPHTPLRLITGLAEGADRIAAGVFLMVRERLQSKGIGSAKQWSLVVALPMPEGAYVEDFPETREYFGSLLKQSDLVVTLTKDERPSGEQDDAWRLRGYQALARYVSRHANILAAFWDGVYLDRPGGTSDIVKTRLGMRHGESLSNLYLECGLVWYLPVRRKNNLGDIASKNAPPLWLSPELQDFSFSQTERDFEAIEQFNRTATSSVVADRAAVQALELSPSKVALSGLVSEDPIDIGNMLLVQASADVVAIDCEQARRKIVRTMYVLAGMLALALWTGLDGLLQPVMAISYIALTFTLFALFRKLKSTRLVDVPIYFRYISEALRISIYARLAPCRELDSLRQPLSVQPLQTLLVQQLHEIGWVREALRMDLCKTPEHVSAELAKEHHEHWIETQMAYFRKSERRHLKTGSFIGLLSWVLGLAGLFAAAAVIGHDMLDLQMPALRHVISISAAVLPALAVLLQSYSDRMVIDQQAKSAIRMQWIFGRAREAYFTNDSGKVKDTESLQALFSEALLESTNWLVSRKSRPPSIPS